MAWTTALSPAKVNLFLELGARRGDGFHEIDTVMVKVGLFDRLAFRVRRDHDIRIHVRDQSASGLPDDSRNLVWQAIELMRKQSERTFGMDVVLEKRIPVQAGLGGGSSNATTTLLTVNRMMKLGIARSGLASLASQLGSDQAFFFASAAARCTGRGEHMEPLPGFQRLWIVIGMPPQGLETGAVFRQLPAVQTAGNDASDAMRSGADFCRNWSALTATQISSRIYNRLQPAARTLNPWIDRMRDAFARVNCFGHQMSGSGSSYFGVFNKKQDALIASRRLRCRMPCSRFFLVPTIRTKPEPNQLAS